MKRIKYLTLILVAVIFVLSCSDPNPTEIPKDLNFWIFQYSLIYVSIDDYYRVSYGLGNRGDIPFIITNYNFIFYNSTNQIIDDIQVRNNPDLSYFTFDPEVGLVTFYDIEAESIVPQYFQLELYFEDSTSRSYYEIMPILEFTETIIE